MAQSDSFADSILELNIRNIRRELIQMIEEFEKQDCLVCLQLKCQCRKTTDEGRRSTGTRVQDIFNTIKENNPNNVALANLQSKSKFYNGALDVSAVKDNYNGMSSIVEASKTANKLRMLNDSRITTDVLASLRKYWSDNNDMNKGRIANGFKKDVSLIDSSLADANAVELFFNSFKVNSNVTPNIAYINKIATGNLHHKSRSSEYSYF